jgi:N-methylhydantoinase A
VSDVRIGIDIGGTFTDIVALRRDGSLHTKKVSSTVDDYSRAIVTGLGEILRASGFSVAEVAEIRHGTTVASNAILERKGARTGLIATAGFRDILEIRTLRMPRLYDMTWQKPPVLVPRYLRVTVDERLDAAGRVQRPLAPEDAARAVRRLLDERVEAIAVCLLHAYANPVHEQLLKDVIQRLAPDLPCAISSEVLPEIREYERTSTTVIDAYVQPVVRRYLRSLQHHLEAAGARSPLLLMQSNGGLMTARSAAEAPVHIVESGPAAGVVGAQALAAAAGLPRIITLDMGGTTAKAALVEDGEVTRAAEYQVGGGIMTGSRLLTGAGYTMKVPAIDLAEVGAGRRVNHPRRRMRRAPGRPRERRGDARPGVLRSARRGAHGHRRSGWRQASFHVVCWRRSDPTGSQTRHDGPQEQPIARRGGAPRDRRDDRGCRRRCRRIHVHGAEGRKSRRTSLHRLPATG